MDDNHKSLAQILQPYIVQHLVYLYYVWCMGSSIRKHILDEDELSYYTGCLGQIIHTNILLSIRLVGGIDAHYASFESLDPPSFQYMTERMDDWNPPESWKNNMYHDDPRLPSK